MNKRLYVELLRAHNKAATGQDNASWIVAQVSYTASGSLTQALAAATLAQGGLHAPIEEARELLRRGDSAAEDAQVYLAYGCKVPGFGNSFFKDGDPAFRKVEKIVRKEYPEVAEIIDNIRETNPKLPPANAAMWTAAVLEILRMPIGIGPAIFVEARVMAWATALIKSDLGIPTEEESEDVTIEEIPDAP